MSNVTSGTGPWVIDTASATAITSDALAIDHITWETGTSSVATDECKVTDNSATPLVLLDTFAAGAEQQIDRKMSKLPINGLIVPTLAHGKVFVYFR